MKILFQSPNLTVKEETRSTVEQALYGLGEKYDWIDEAIVFVKKENNDIDRDKIIEFKIHVPNHWFYAKGQENTFGQAVNEAAKGIDHQLRKFKGKERSHPVETPL